VSGINQILGLPTSLPNASRGFSTARGVGLGSVVKVCFGKVSH
jgi:hypothetical protein